MNMPFDKLTIGVCYYPEHWDESLWDDDMRRISACGLEVIRIAEFSWAIMEPCDSKFDFSLFDRFLPIVRKHGLSVILGTPTATPPAWLTKAYPEVLNVTRDGVTLGHGMRRHYNYSSPVYRMYAARIVEKMAEHFAGVPGIIGWQLDNEFNCETDVFYSQRDNESFRLFLKEKYKSLEELNRAWGTVFWSQTYTDWEQVCLLKPSVSGSANPHQALDEKRFISHNAISFAKMQADILRAKVPARQFIMTNGMFTHLDNHRLTREVLDFYTYDSYPNFGASKNDDELRDRKWSMNLSVVRSICPRFGIMEQQSGANGWHDSMASRAPRPGQMRLWAFQSIAHGADFVSFFRWRTCTFGTEMYWHGILDYDNRDNRKLAEVARFIKDAKKVSFLAGSEYAAGIALLRDYDNEWDGERDVWSGPMRKKSEKAWYTAAVEAHAPMDVVYINDDTEFDALSKYSLLVYPHPTIMTESRARILEEYVKRGGTLVFGARTGYKDIDGHCPMRPAPGLLRNLCGCEVNDFTLIMPGESISMMIAGERVEAAGCADMLVLTDSETRVTAEYSADDYMDSFAAMTERKLGKGLCVYFGSGFTTLSALELMKRYKADEPCRNEFELPRKCEIAVRRAGDAVYWIILNYAEEAVINVKTKMREILEDRLIEGSTKMDRYGVMVLKKAEE